MALSYGPPSPGNLVIKEDPASKYATTVPPAHTEAHPEATKRRIAVTMILLSAFLSLLATSVFRYNFFTHGASVSPLVPAGDIIDTGYAKYLGNRSFPNTVAYLGVPYAEPPLGDRRFRAPLPLNKARITRESQGRVIDATKNPEFCIQGTIGQGDAGGAGSEDCLKVNIYAPVGAKSGSKLPVLVYIHGGGYVFGNPANWPFDHWINQSPNVVIVSVYYRLSSFGFLAHPSFRDTKGATGDLNAGFLDQIQALKWVQENIASFGGDPGKVTITGESAGGSSVELHLVVNGGKEGAPQGTPGVLFHQAIAQSVYRTPLPTPEQQELLFNFYANFAGCGRGSVATQLSCLRKASVSALARAQDAGQSGQFNASGYNTWHPVIDNKLFTEFPTQSVLSGKFAKVPLIVGATTNETLSGGTDITGALKSFFPSITTAAASQLIAQYPAAEFASVSGLQLQTVTGDAELRCARSLLGLAYSKTSKSYTYRYNQPTPGANQVFHAAENFMMFKGTSTGTNGTTTFNALTPTENAFAQELIAYWLSFVRGGDPTTFKLARSPKWPRFDASVKTRIVLQEGTTSVSGSVLESETDEETMRCAFIAGQVGLQQN